MSRVLDLTRGYQVVLDDEDYDRFSDILWQAHIVQGPGRKYVYAWHSFREGVGTPVKKRILHREVSGGKSVRFLDGNTLNLQRSNLQIRPGKVSR